ncbi:MAG: DUF2723 domain-containing protein [Muribaculaceae bacterium]|nr:DUF2723 domain-containing protein [Muribaculaceae bacterium]
MITRQYRLINNAGGWFVFIIALLTYWLTLEPTASYWDCGEFIIQADKLEVGHPPGNPIFMLTARFFANFAPSIEKVSVMVNAMSGLFSALTILLLFWTITHLVRRLLVADDSRSELTIQQYLLVMGSGLVGSLAYCWSDTFWFSAVEGEVYAFSSFCTALVFWLILKWENRADEPHSDRYLILIAYIIGVSVAVHLLNLLCIPAIVLVFTYKKWPSIGLVGSLVALLVSFAIVFFVLYGLVPGFIKVAQVAELLFVNGFHLSFNSGALAYAIAMIISLFWALYSLYTQRSEWQIKVSFILVVTLSGVLFIGSGITIGIVLSVALIALLFWGFRQTGLPVRALNVIMWSIAVIFAGYSSYALIIIRSTADTPMNQNSPDNVFALASYLNREQYGDTPLFYGETLYSNTQREISGDYTKPRVTKGEAIYTKGVAEATPRSEYDFLTNSDIQNNEQLRQRGGDYYVKQDYKAKYKMNPELDMVFPRLYSRAHVAAYKNWVRLDTVSPSQIVPLTLYDPATGENVYPEMYGYPAQTAFKPTFKQNLEYFFAYQLNHMYMRYFLWNFVGRQNDINNQRGELDAGNWISGIPFVDNARLGDQSLLPDYLGKGNKGHNTFYFLPLLLGLVGLIWQSFAGRRGIEQFWVVFFLFFMTGIAIVLYLNQTPDQPRERDYAFAGSFYAFAIWIGMGVAGLWRLLTWGLSRTSLTSPKETEKKEQEEGNPRLSPARMGLIASGVALVLGICVPLQMVSQTWDDHDRSGRYAARDFAINYLESLEPNAIVFCNGDNDTFPLWYVQEVEGVRPDVRIINLSYLNSDWYANQHRMQAYDAAPAPLTAKPEDIAYGKNVLAVLPRESIEGDLLQSLRALYASVGVDPNYGYPKFASSIVTIPIDKQLMVKRGLVAPQDTADIVNEIRVDLRGTAAGQRGYITLGEILMLDIIATNAAQGWPRPIYWASTVGDSYYLGFDPYMRSTGMTLQLVPTMTEDRAPRTDRAYDVITKKYQWGSRPDDGVASPYFDETARRMLYGVRNSMIDVAGMLYEEGCLQEERGEKKQAMESVGKARQLLLLLEEKTPESVSYYELGNALTMGELYGDLGIKLADKKLRERGLEILKSTLERYAGPMKYRSEIAYKYVNPMLTHEMYYLPGFYYQLAVAYENLGGDQQFIDSLLRGSGWTWADLKRYYEGGGSPAATEQFSLQDFALQIIDLCEEVNRLQQLSPDEYAKEPLDLRQMDTLLLEFIDVYISNGGQEADLEQYDAYRKVDRVRSERLRRESEQSL